MQLIFQGGIAPQSFLTRQPAYSAMKIRRKKGGRCLQVLIIRIVSVLVGPTGAQNSIL